MVTRSLSKLAAVAGGLALSVLAGAGIASADPDMGPAINTTCSYPQVMAALNATVTGRCREVQRLAHGAGLAAAVPRFAAAAARSRWRSRRRDSLAASQYFGLIGQVVGTCNNY